MTLERGGAPVPVLLVVRFSCTCHGCSVGVAVRRVTGSCVGEGQEGPTPPYSLLFPRRFCCLGQPLRYGELKVTSRCLSLSFCINVSRNSDDPFFLSCPSVFFQSVKSNDQIG
jgi:hypothetical protein